MRAERRPQTVKCMPLKTFNHQYLCLTNTQLMILEKWVEGEFINDLKLPDDDSTHVDITKLYHHTHHKIEHYPIADQPLELDRAAMHFCLGGAFHPGCEMTWPMRHRTMYRAPFRIRPRTKHNPEPDYGDHLTYKEVMDDTGPLYFNEPGDITRWMAVPWQTDTSSCRSGYIPEYDPFLPTFWPARVPNPPFFSASSMLFSWGSIAAFCVAVGCLASAGLLLIYSS